jgi:hypothetical protein
MCIKLRTDDDYADDSSSTNEDTTYNTRTREGSHVELGLVLDRVVCLLWTLFCLSNSISFYKHINYCRVLSDDDL